jgi:hypothetical protein
MSRETAPLSTPAPRRLTIRHLMLAVLLSAIALLPIAELSRGTGLDGVAWVIAVDLVALPVLLVLWNNRIKHDRGAHRRNRVVIWTGIVAGYVALVGWLLHRIGRI